jgi:nitrogen fixation protein FixH
MTGTPMLQAGRSPWPLAIGLGLLGTCAIQLTMVAIATTHRSAPASADHEVESLQFDRVLAARNRAAALGWRVDVESCVRNDGGCTLAVSVRDADGHPVSGLHGEIAAARADDASFDRRASVRALAPGRYASTLELGAGGVYRLEITLEGGAAPWIGTREVLAPEAP